MCHQIKLLNQTKNGSILHCDSCKLYHLIFGHFHLEFSRSELKNFMLFLKNINVPYWEYRYQSKLIKRKIPIPTLQKNLSLVLNQKELDEIKNLLFGISNLKNINYVNSEDIDYDFISN
ncbi:DUF6686 family protein [Aquimarina sp. 2201CG5-10]|uniref:DUF6686 family protein n=1 Tax=Aquimarina callyspongiae TaxID=3098150 RepID=UPI002AB4AFA9|nr:DUF6686 family protein [Aquimarina sp. 2201CG5-10]MDY8135942.1 DUF6686 family protein [Aquimarina sp. 2201CG5-10]